MTKSSAKPEVQLLIDACIKGGVTHIVLSPGSRNAPLSIAFDEHPAITAFVVPDERAAAFYALGMAQQLGQPVAIACTSGSAPLNYFPAVAEAYYQGVPLIVLTADRPREWVDQGDGQTIVQENVFGTHVLAAAQLDTIHNDAQRWHFERKCSEVIQAANGRRKGPVHLNVPFSEPLYEVTDETMEVRQWIHRAEGEIVLSEPEEAFVLEKWNNARRRMVICGQMEKNDRLQQALSALVENPAIAVLVEHTSNLQHERFIMGIDKALNQIHEEEIRNFQPDVIVVLGGAIVSKRIKAFLRNAQAETIRIGNDFPYMDTFRSLIFTSQTDAAGFISLLAEKGEPNAVLYGAAWKKLELKANKKHADYLQNCVFSDLKATETVLNGLPAHVQLHLGNSSIIRYALLFDPRKETIYRCNRGTSGIDGSTSTACGMALAGPEQLNVLISGDMSFFYDSNAFWTNKQPANLRVIVLNNGGGDIFNIIPGPDTTPQKDKYFVAKQSFSAEYICKAYGVEYASAGSQAEIEAALPGFLKEGEGPKVLEIHTAGIDNSGILRRYFASAKE